MCQRFMMILVVSMFSSTALAEVDYELLKMSAEAGNALKTADDAFSDLNSVLHMVQDIENKRKPNVTESRWTELATEYQQAAATLSQAPLPTDFNREKYRFSIDELNYCDTDDQSLAKATGYLSELRGALPRGQDEVGKLDLRLNRIAAARQALTYLISVHDKLITVPIYGEIFKWDWLELNTEVSDSLNTLQAAVNAQKKKLTGEMAKISQYITNLQSNLSLLEQMEKNCADPEKLTDAKIMGVWNFRVAGDANSETRKGSGVKIVDKKLGPGLYSVTSTWSETRTLKPGYYWYDGFWAALLHDKSPRTYNNLSTTGTWRIMDGNTVREDSDDGGRIVVNGVEIYGVGPPTDYIWTGPKTLSASGPDRGTCDLECYYSFSIIIEKQ